MDEFFDLLAVKSNGTRESFAQPRIGTVTSSNSQTATARVLLQPEGVLTGWLPVLTQWAGPGWGMMCPPCPGDQVLIIPQEGSAQHGLIVGRLYSNAVHPPRVESGEIAFSHRSGCSLRLLNSGVVAIAGDLHVSGDVYDAHGSVSRLRDDYNIHTHHTSNGQITSDPLPLD